MPLDGKITLQSHDILPLRDDEACLAELAIDIREMRARTFAHFAEELSAAMPQPAPQWAQMLLMRWGAESLR